LGIRITPNGLHAYVSSFQTDTIGQYSVDPIGGALSPTGNVVPAGTEPVGIAVDPGGRFLYVANSGSDDVSGFAISAVDGTLSALPGSPYSAGTSPAFVAIHPGGGFAYVVNSDSSDVSAYAIDPVTGALSAVPGSPFVVGAAPTGVAVDPTGTYAYVASGGSSEVWGFSIAATGALAGVPGSPFPGPSGSFVAGVTVDPAGRYVYAVGSSGPTHGYEIDPANGSLAPVPGSPFGLPNNGAVAADPTGRFVYTGQFPGAGVQGYRIDAATGALTPLAGSPFPSGFPIALTTLDRVVGEGTATILNDDSLTLSVDDVSVAETNAGGQTVGFTVALSGAGAAPVTVGYATADGSATLADADYVAASGSLTFAPGETSQPVSVTVNGDSGFEPNETFVLGLSNAQGAAIADGQGQGTIVNDDAATAADSRIELAHGSSLLRSLGAVGTAAFDDYFRIREGGRSSYEVLLDAGTGDIGPDGPALERIASDGSTVLQSSVAAGAGPSRSLAFENTSSAARDEFVRVRSLGCGTGCGPGDTYALRVYETTLSVARFNNSGSQSTVLILQNTSSRAVTGTIWLRDQGGALITSAALSVPPRAVRVLGTAALAPGASGTIAISHDGRYGDIAGKAVAVEPATGFTFDSPVVSRPR
jgi:6-phosphogluconolactonase (cycloisomerase 2 family)